VLLARWADPTGLTRWEREWLISLEEKFGAELQPTRRRPAKVSADAKAALLLFELEQRRHTAGGPTADHEPSDLILLALFRLAPKAAGLYAARDERWDEWVRTHSKEYSAVLGLVDRMMEDGSVIAIGKGRGRVRVPVGERRHARERYDGLRDELGENFIENRIGRAAQVRAWDKRRRDREACTRG